MEIKSEDVKALREKTGAGMMDCKKALTQANGDFKQAEKILKELGLAAAAKRGSRATTEGRVFTAIVGKTAAVVELSCETDFVARNADFVALGKEIVKAVAGGAPITDATLAGKVTELAAVIKENMSIRRSSTISLGANDMAVEYVHGEGRIGVLVKLSADKAEVLANQDVKTFAFDCALHIAAYNPMFLSEDKIPAAYLKEQEEIFTKQAENLGKPANVLQGIIKGKIKKHVSEICLLDQAFVKDDKRSVSQVAKDLSKQAGGTLTISDYRYFRVGEESAE